LAFYFIIIIIINIDAENLEALAASFGCFGAVFGRFSTSRSRRLELRNAYF
jgi:hypothetical protein